MVKSAVTMAMTTALFVGSMGATAHAAPMKGATKQGAPSVVPNVAPCQQFTNADKFRSVSGVDPVSGGSYTLTVYVEFRYDAFFDHSLCWTRSKAVLVENGNLFGGTLNMTLNNCSSNVDTVSPSVPGGGGTFTYYGNQLYAECGKAWANFQASNGFRLPSQGDAFSDRQTS